MITQAAADTHSDFSGVYAAFARLSGDDRDVIGLRIIAGFTTAQAAVGLGVTPAARSASPRPGVTSGRSPRVCPRAT